MRGAHVPALTLRRLRADELDPAAVQGAQEHLGACEACRELLRSFDEEQARFERAVPLDRFVAGVERAARQRAKEDRPQASWRPVLPRLLGAFAVAGLAGLVLLRAPSFGERPGPLNRTKGGADVTIRVAASSGEPQRTASPSSPEVLSPGERIRIGYSAGPHRYLASVSIDSAGEVTPLYPESGRSLLVDGDEGPHYLPGALEFEGRGAERVVVVLSHGPLEVEAVRRAARAAYDASGGDLLSLGRLEIPGEQFHRTFLKP